MKKLILILLFTYADILVAQPSIQWQKCLGGTDGEGGVIIQQTTGGGFIMAGYTASNDGDVTGNHGNFDIWVVKLNSTGIIQWQKSLGGTGFDNALSIQQTTDGGYIVAGSSNSNDSDVTGNHGSYDFWVVKLSSTGIIQWEKSLGGTGNDFAESIQQTIDGGYIVVGKSDSNNGNVTGNHGQNDCWVVKLNSTGVIQWQKSLGGTGYDGGASIQQTTDGYIVAGFSNSNDGDVTGNHGDFDYWLVKLNTTGVIQWQKSLGGTGIDVANSIQQTPDSGYIVAGYSGSNDGDVTGSHGNHDYWIVKLNSTGTMQWQKCLGGTLDDDAISIQQTTDGGYVVGGDSYSNDSDVTGNHGDSDYWIVKLNNTGAIMWQKCIGGTGLEALGSIRQTTDGGYVVAGSTLSNNGNVTGNHGLSDYWIVKLSPVTEIEEIRTTISDIQIIPNPVSQSTVISFSLLQSENISANIYDITGRLVKNLFDGNLNSGNHEIKWNVTEERAVDDGVYLLNFSGENFSQSVKLIVVE